MRKILSAREKIYNHIDGRSGCGWRDITSHKALETYCIAKDTIQDTGEALFSHRQKGFSGDVYLRYVEYYGVLQAVFMQQDAISALYGLFMTPPEIDDGSLKNWRTLRDMRNHTVGHPIGRLQRLNRNQIEYDRVNYMRCPSSDVSTWVSSNVNLGALLDAYDSEAADILERIWECMESECRDKHRRP